jgi:hypothetical protein
MLLFIFSVLFYTFPVPAKEKLNGDGHNLRMTTNYFKIIKSTMNGEIKYILRNVYLNLSIFYGHMFTLFYKSVMDIHLRKSLKFSGAVVYTEENTQQSTGSFGSENLNEDSNLSYADNSEPSENNENSASFFQDSNDTDSQMRVCEFCCWFF